MRVDLRRVLAFLVVELLAMIRDPLGLAAILAAMIGVGALAPGSVELKARFAPTDDSIDVGPAPSFPCEAGVMAPVAVAGDVPAWLRWPDPFVASDAAEILLRFDGDTVDIVELTTDARDDAVQGCLRARIGALRRDRLHRLGLWDEPGSVTVVDVLAPEPSPREAAPPVGAALLGGLAFLLASVFLELGPRHRASGWLETVFALPGSRGDLVLAWWLLGVLLSLVGVAFVLAGERLASAWLDVATTPAPWALFPVLIVLVSAVGVRAFCDVPDLRAAIVQSVPALLLLLGLTAVAQLLESQLPGLGGLMPVGGLALAFLGRTDGIYLAAGSGIVATVFLLIDAVRVLDGLAVRTGPVSATAARRAAGDYFPEVLLLVLVAVAGVGAWAPPELILGDPVVRTAAAFVLFLFLPAVATPYVLGLDPRDVLGWRPPPLRAWLAIPALVLSTLGLGTALMDLAMRLFPERELLGLVERAIGEMNSPIGLVFLSIGPGIAEELLFRGAMLGLLRRRFPTWVAIVLQAVAFAVVHGLAVRLLHTFALGVIYGIVATRTRSLWPTMLAHAAHNLLAVLFAAHLGALAGWQGWALGLVGLAVAWLAGGLRR